MYLLSVMFPSSVKHCLSVVSLVACNCACSHAFKDGTKRCVLRNKYAGLKKIRKDPREGKCNLYGTFCPGIRNLKLNNLGKKVVPWKRKISEDGKQKFIIRNSVFPPV